MSTCPVCGRVHLIVWPQFWPYRRGARLFCSEDCLIVYVTQQNFSKCKGEQKKLARLKNDGTPAKKPGRKPKTQTPEAEKIEIVENPESFGHFHNSDRTPPPPPKPKKTETPETNKVEVVETPETPPTRIIKRIGGKYEVSAIRVNDLGEFYYDIKFNCIDWRALDGAEVSLTPAGWKHLMEELPAILSTLGVKA